MGADTVADAERRRGLRRMKLVALSFLVGATVVFLLCTWAQSNGAAAWVGYVRAAAEAGMVGALADWFAVTALFKHPLGIPIPHTAIIKRKKDQLGEGLGAFVRENFMSPEVVETKLRDAHVAGRVGDVGVAVSPDRHPAAAGRGEPDHDPHRGRLPGAVRAEEAGDPAGLGGEGHVVDGEETAVGLGEPVNSDHVSTQPERGGPRIRRRHVAPTT